MKTTKRVLSFLAVLSLFVLPSLTFAGQTAFFEIINNNSTVRVISQTARTYYLYKQGGGLPIASYPNVSGVTYYNFPIVPSGYNYSYAWHTFNDNDCSHLTLTACLDLVPARAFSYDFNNNAGVYSTGYHTFPAAHGISILGGSTHGTGGTPLTASNLTANVASAVQTTGAGLYPIVALVIGIFLAFAIARTLSNMFKLAKKEKEKSQQ